MPDPPLSNMRPPVAGFSPGWVRARYAELHCKTNFSFLEGASHPDELVVRAAELGYTALAVTDRNSLAGVVRAHMAAKQVGLKLLIGAELTPDDAPPLVVWATDRASYGRLARLITCGRRRAAKGEFQLTLADIAQHSAGLLAAVGSFELPSKESVSRYRDIFGDRLSLLAELYLGPNDERRLEDLMSLSRQARVPLLAAGDVHYHRRARLALQDVLTAVRLGCTVSEAGEQLFPNAERYLKSPAQMYERFARMPAAVARTAEIAELLERSPADVRLLQHRALTSLRTRLSAVGRDSGGARPVHWRRLVVKAHVLRSRRAALS